jgi:hypothetical protein
VTGPTIPRPRIPAGIVDRLAVAFCRWFGCAWEVRRGYDWCPRCGASQWHIVSREAPAA